MHSRITLSCCLYKAWKRNTLAIGDVALETSLGGTFARVKADSSSQAPQLAVRATLGTMGPALALNDDSNGP